jgi:hypothetical protein
MKKNVECRVTSDEWEEGKKNVQPRMNTDEHGWECASEGVL